MILGSKHFSPNGNHIENLDLSAINTYSIKKLRFVVFVAAQSLDSFGKIMQFALKSCPHLEKLDLSSFIPNVKPDSCLDICLHDNPYLKFVKVDMNNAYYTFSDMPQRQGKRYRDKKNILTSTPLLSDKYYINLAWNGNVMLNLTTTNKSCKVRDYLSDYQEDW